MSNQEPNADRWAGRGTPPPGPEGEDRGGGDRPESRFTLYVRGASEKSRRAVADARRLCDEHLGGHYVLLVVDLCRQPGLAESQGIFALPTLVSESPRPPRRFTGDLSDNGRLLDHLTPRPGAGR